MEDEKSVAIQQLAQELKGKASSGELTRQEVINLLDKKDLRTLDQTKEWASQVVIRYQEELHQSHPEAEIVISKDPSETVYIPKSNPDNDPQLDHSQREYLVHQTVEWAKRREGLKHLVDAAVNGPQFTTISRPEFPDQPDDNIKLRNYLVGNFTSSELGTKATDFSADAADSLAGTTIESRAQQLVSFAQRRERVDELRAKVAPVAF